MKLHVSLALAAGLALPSTATFAAVTIRGPHPAAQIVSTPHAYFGTLLITRTTVLTVRLRTGQTLVVDATRAVARGQATPPFVVGSSLAVTGDFTGGALVATSVRPVTPIAAFWPPDR